MDLTLIAQLAAIGNFLLSTLRFTPQIVASRNRNRIERQIKEAYYLLLVIAQDAIDIFNRVQHLSNLSSSARDVPSSVLFGELQGKIAVQKSALEDLKKLLRTIRDDTLVFLHPEIDLDNEISRLGDMKVFWLEHLQAMPEPHDPNHADFLRDYLNDSRVEERVSRLEELVEELRRGIREF